MKTGTAVRMSAAVACGAENVSTVPGVPHMGAALKTQERQGCACAQPTAVTG